MQIIRVYVITRSLKNKIRGWKEDSNGNKILRIGVTSPPENNKANEDVIETISKEFKIPKSAIEIVKGKTSRNKSVRISVAWYPQNHPLC